VRRGRLEVPCCSGTAHPCQPPPPLSGTTPPPRSCSGELVQRPAITAPHFTWPWGQPPREVLTLAARAARASGLLATAHQRHQQAGSSASVQPAPQMLESCVRLPKSSSVCSPPSTLPGTCHHMPAWARSIDAGGQQSEAGSRGDAGRQHPYARSRPLEHPRAPLHLAPLRLPASPPPGTALHAGSIAPAHRP
jgi:hypothetical protein